MDRSSSFSSASSGMSGSSVGSRASAAAGGQEEKEGQAADILEQNATFQAGVFGVLFTLSKEKFDSSTRFAFAKLILDFLQMFILIVSSDFGWNLDESLWIWKAIDWVKFSNPIVNRGYTFYIVILYIIAVLLLISVLLCIWVGWCFKNDRFPYVWPIKMLRVVVAVFVSVFYIGSLAIFMTAINCQWFSSYPDMKFHLNAFPEKECLTMPHLIHLVVACICSAVFFTIAFATTLADFEMNPVSQRWLASPHSRIEIRGLMVKTIMTVTVSVLYTKLKIQAVILMVTACFLWWSYVRWQPHFNQWINHTRAALYSMIAWTTIILTVMQFRSDSYVDNGMLDMFSQMTTVMLAGLAPVAFASFFISYGRLRWRMQHALKAFRNVPTNMHSLKDIYTFSNPYEVEIVSRVCRKYTEEDDEVLEPAGIKLADWILKVGLAYFPTSCFMVITYSNFLIEVMHNVQSGSTQLQHAKKLKPGVANNFAIFVREQEHKQQSQTQNSGESATDLVSYVEFQRNFKLLVKTHKLSLTATKFFWKMLLHREVSFQALANSFRIIDESKSKADKTFKMVLDRYPSSVKLLRSYGRFLEEVKNDPWSAAKYFDEADKAEEQQENANTDAMIGGMNEGQGGGVLAAVDDKNTAVVMINATGIIQMANKPAIKMFGYKKGELEGKNVSILMPPPFNQRHNGYLRNYQTTGKAKILDSVREVVGVHKERFVFPLKIAVTKVSGNGADAIFMGVLKQSEDDPKIVKAWVMPTGAIVCVDARFSDWFGKSFQEVAGRSLSSLVTEQDIMIKLLDKAQNAQERDFQAGRVAAKGVNIVHKYTEPVKVNITMELGGTESQRLLVVLMRKVDDTVNNMMVVDNKGRIMYMNSDLRAILGYEARDLKRMDLSNLMNPPYANLHTKWMKDPPARMPMQSCRSGAAVVMTDSKGDPFPVRNSIITREDGDSVMHVVNVHKCSWEDGLDERRLTVVINHKGEVLEAGNSPMSLFGFKPTSLVGLSITHFIDVFLALRNEVEELVAKMIMKNSDSPGTSWRVGVHPLVHGDHNSQSEVAKAVLKKNTKPALMQIDFDEEDTSEAPVIKLYLWRADAVTGVVNMDKDTIITKPACCVLHSTGLLFGVSNKALMRQPLRKFVRLPGRAADSLLQDNKAVKGAMKSGTSGRKVGPSHTLEAYHWDGSPLQLKVVGVSVENKHVIAKINFNSVVKGDPEKFKATFKARVDQAMEREPEEAAGVKKSVPLGVSAVPAARKTGVKFAGMPDDEDDKKNGDASDSASGSDDDDNAVAEADRKDMFSAQEGHHQDDEVLSEGSENAEHDATAEEEAVRGYQADYKRGKRYKKLVKLLSSKVALQALNRYAKHTWFIIGLLLLAHTACFIGFLFLLNNQDDYVHEVSGCADASYFLHRVHIGVRSIGNLYQNRENALWYAMETDANGDPAVPQYILDHLKEDIDAMELAHQGLYLGFKKLRHLGADYDMDMIWEDKDSNEALYIDTRVPYFADESNSLWLMGNQFIASAREILSNHKLLATDWSNNLTLSRDWNYVNKNGPAAITAGYRQSMGAMVQRTWDSTGTVSTWIMVLMVFDGIIVAGVAMIWTGLLVQSLSQQRYTLFIVFLLVPNGLLKMLATKQVSVEGEKDEDDSDDEGGGPAARAKAQMDAQATIASMTIPTKGAIAAVTSVHQNDSGLSRFLRMLNPMAWFTNEEVEINKKKLIKDNYDTLRLMFPFILWGILCIVLYLVSNMQLDSALKVTVSLEMYNRVKVSQMRCLAQAHELVSQTTNGGIDDAQRALALRQAEFRHLYDALLYGDDDLGSEMVFSSATGTLFGIGAEPSSLFFREQDICHVPDDKFRDLYCFEKGEMYYEITHHGIDPMVRRFIAEMNLLVNDPYIDINMNSTRFDYIWRVAYQSMMYGVISASAVYTDAATGNFTAATTIMIILFVLTWVLAIMFVFFMFKPFVKRTASEGKQIAELLTQLPAEMDVEGLVVSALSKDEEDDPEEALANARGEGRRNYIFNQTGSFGPEHSKNSDNSSLEGSM